MKTVIIYYSFSGKTRNAASKMAEQEGADLIEVKEKKARSLLGAYFSGSISALRQKKSDIEPVTCDFNDYERIIIAAPVWAGHPAPAMNSIIELIPVGRQIELVLTSGGGDSGRSAEKTKKLASNRGLTVLKYTDIKS